MEKKPKGRGSLLEEVLKNSSRDGRRADVTTQKVDIGIPQSSACSTIQSLPSSSQGRGNILSRIVSQAKPIKSYGTKVQETKDGAGPVSFGLGRGSFLAKLAQQAKSWDRSLESSSPSIGSTYVGGVQLTTPSFKSIIDKTETLSIETEQPPCIKKGEVGQQINVATNFVALKTEPGKSVYEFEVKFSPEIDFVAYRYKLVNQHLTPKKGIKCYDGGTKLYLPEKITSDTWIIEAKHPCDNSPISLSVIYKRQMTLRECSSLYNILFYNCAKVLRFARLGRENYDFKQGHQIPQHKLEVWPGYVTSVREFEGGVLLCCDIKHRVLRIETAYDVLSNIAKSNPNNVRNLAARELLGQCVLTRYNNNLYRIDDIDWTKTPLSLFKLASGEEISFLEYYKKQYNLDILDLKQPLLISKPKSKGPKDRPQLICLVPEICNMTGLTDTIRNDMRVMKEIANYTRITPAQRDFAFKKFLDNLRSNTIAQEMLKDWGLSIAEERLETYGRILPVENIVLKDKYKVPAPLNASWATFLRNHGVLRSIDLQNWLLLHINRDKNLANKFKEMLKKVGPGLGIDILDPVMVSLNNDRIDSYIQGLRNNITPKTQVVVCLCPTSRTDRYSAIKKFCCREVPILSQVVNCTTISRENKMVSVVQNLALQINNKLGGASWAIHVPLKNCMICGIDTYHEKNCDSVGGFVASIDEEYTKWFSQTCIQESQQELLNGLVLCFISALKKYLTVNKMLPDRIVVFRDGVGDGMLRMVQEHEVQQFLDACLLVCKDYKPRLSFIVVKKRINTKFYLLPEKSNNLDNPVPGSVLDHTITNRNYYDFFLVSQYVSCGTATPSHYIVLYDNSDLKPDLMQRLTYKFCHLYYNWPGTVRVPAPCQYAHKLAYLIGQCVKGPASELLEDKLYYI